MGLGDRVCFEDGVCVLGKGCVPGGRVAAGSSVCLRG